MKAAYWNLPLDKPIIVAGFAIAVESASRSHANIRITPLQPLDFYIQPLDGGGIRLTDTPPLKYVTETT